MRITPLDIRKQEFHKVMRGLDSEEVYAFLSTVGDEYETLLNENKALRDRLLELDDKVQEYRLMEKNLRNTLLTAERVAVESKDNARREANLIIKEAQIEAEKALRDIKSEAMKLRQEVQLLRRQRDGYLARMKVVAESHVKFLETAEADFGKEDELLEDSPAGDEAPRTDQAAANANLFTTAPSAPEPISTETPKIDPDDVPVSALADTPMGSTVESIPVQRASLDTDALAVSDTDRATPQESPRLQHEISKETGDNGTHGAPSESPGEPGVPTPVETAVPTPADPGGASTLSEINDILERMAEGQREIMNAAPPDRASGLSVDQGETTSARFEPIPKSPPTESIRGDVPYTTANKPDGSPTIPAGRAWEQVVTPAAPSETPPYARPDSESLRPSRADAEEMPEDSTVPSGDDVTTR